MTSILVVGPHPDDQELGMGGTIARLAAQGHRVHLLDITDGEPTPHGSKEIRKVETAAATAILRGAAARGGKGGTVTRSALDLPNRFVEHTVEARHQVAGVMRAVQAQVVFVPFFEDAHPDHRAVTRIVEDARFDAKLTKVEMPGSEGGAPVYPRWLFYYYATHLRWVADPSFLIDTTGFEGVKREAVMAYHSQFVANENNRKVTAWLDAAGAYFGSRIGTAAAEPFFTKEPIGLTGLEGLAV